MSIKVENIPNDWQLKKLKDVSEFSNGKGHEQCIDENGQYIVVNSKFISTDGRVKKFSSQNLSPLNFGDITMVMSDIPNGKAIAKCFIIEEDNRYTLNQRICSIKSNENCDNKFLYYVINRNRYYLAFDNGVSQTNFRKDEVLDCPVQFPPLPEQQKIAEILSTVDDKIEVIDQQIIETQALKKGLMQRLLTKGIGHTEFKDSPLGMIPKSWEAVPFDIACINVSTKFKKEKGNCIELEHVEQATGRLLGNDRIEDKSSIKNDFKIGDVLFCKLRPYLRKYWECTFDGGCTSELMVLRPTNKFSTKYLFYTVQTDSFIENSVSKSYGTKMPRTSWKILSEYQLGLPPVSEQLKIAEILSSVDEKLEVLSNKKTHYQELKQGLMQQLLTGKIRVKV